MGPSVANKMILFNEKINAETALRSGLVAEIYDEPEKILKKVENFAKNPTKSLLYSKQLTKTAKKIDYLKSVNRAEGERLRERWASEDCFNAIVNFMSRKHN